MNRHVLLAGILSTLVAAISAQTPPALSTSDPSDSAYFRSFFNRLNRVPEQDVQGRLRMRNEAQLTAQEFAILLSVSANCTGGQAIAGCMAMLEAQMPPGRYKLLHDFVVAFEGPPSARIPPPLRAIVHVEDRFPLAKAASLLESRYGVPISVESNSAYEYERANGFLDVNFPEPENAATPAEVAKILRDLLAQHVKNGNAGQFELLETSEGLVIVPTARKNAAGEVIPDRSPLEQRISFPEADRELGDALDTLCHALGKVIGKPVGLWSNLGIWRGRVRIGADKEPARVVLLRIMADQRWDDSAVRQPSPRVSYALGALGGPSGFSLTVHQVSVERSDRYGRPYRIGVPRTGPLDMDRPALADIPSLRR